MKIHRPRNIMAKAKERIAIGEFVRANYPTDTVITYPDPPDALVELSSGRTIWVEIASVYRDGDVARRLNSVEPGEQMFTYEGTFIEFATKMAWRLYSGVIKKDEKRNYDEYTSKYGKGVLVLYIDEVIFYQEILEQLSNPNLYTHVKLKNFDAVYLFERSYIAGKIGDMKTYPAIFHRII